MSALLSDADLNDFISPGLACVKPTQTRKVETNSLEIEVGTESNEPEKVSISLQDCLACAGCITSSEEILLSKQSHAVFLDAWKSLSDRDGDKPLAISIPPQCRVSLAKFYKMEVSEFDRCFQNVMSRYFKAKYVVGTQVGRSFSISKTNEKLKQTKKIPGKPLICSICPGFVLYAEKTKPELVPYMLNVKSPQQITGNLLKQADPRCYHLSIMPCFDKKLEASREDCAQEVDCVITPREFVTMLEELSINFENYRTDIDFLPNLTPKQWDSKSHWLNNEGSTSGGYAYQYILSVQADFPESRVVTIEGKNNDLLEFQLLSSEGQLLASSSQLYGFRNIQNLVRKISQKATSKKRGVKVLKKRGKPLQNSLTDEPTADDNSKQSSRAFADPLNTDFIEVMACPGGCINGGGLLNGEQNSTRRKALAQELSILYAGIPSVDTNAIAAQYSELVGISSDNSQLQYNLRVLESHPTDVVTVGNTW